MLTILILTAFTTRTKQRLKKYKEGLSSNLEPYACGIAVAHPV